MIPHSKPWLLADDQLAVQEVIHSGMIAEGCMVSKFEGAISRYLGLAGGIATTSGTTALFLALQALEVGGGEVLCPSYVCRAVWQAICWAGARPVLYDLAADWSASEETIRAKITHQTKAIIIVHIFGIVTDAAAVYRLGIPVVEDCCQAIGAKGNEHMAGTLGEYCVLSFQATKLLATGEGGMVLAKNQNYLEKLFKITICADGGLKAPYYYPMSDLQAVLGLNQLNKYDSFLKRRLLIAEHYYNAFSEWPECLPLSIRGKSIFFRFPLFIKELDFKAAREWFFRRGVHVRQGVDTLLHRKLGIADGEYPQSMYYFKRTLSIPIYPALHDWEVEHIVKHSREFLIHHAS